MLNRSRMEQHDKIYYDPTLDLDEKQLKYKAIDHEKNMSNAIGGPANILIYLSIAIFLLAMAMILKEKKLNVAVYTDAKRPPQVPPTNQPKNQLIDQLTNPPTNPQPPKV